MNRLKNKPTGRLILIMIFVVGFSILFTSIYYHNKKNRKDPRVTAARELYKKYNLLAIENRFMEILHLLDSMEQIYSGITHYKDSYELGVLYNNRTASYLTMALFKDSIRVEFDPFPMYSKDSLVHMAEIAVQQSIDLYESWLSEFDSLDYDQVHQKIKSNFLYGLVLDDEVLKEKMLKERVSELLDAQIENKRRLSVSYTNFGVINRYYEDYKKAAQCYALALQYWDRNLTAENNLNRLLGRPLKKRNFLQKLFPPDKKQER